MSDINYFLFKYLMKFTYSFKVLSPWLGPTIGPTPKCEQRVPSVLASLFRLLHRRRGMLMNIFNELLSLEIKNKVIILKLLKVI